ncbi:MAG: PIG-L family deacetylase, partial [Candidatus Omnitrophota bacterium]
MEKVIVVATHPDDETLGAGGTILKHKANGDEVYWLIVTSMQKKFGYTVEAVEERQREIEKVASKYAFNGIYNLDFPTMQLGKIPFDKFISAISDVFK